MKRVVFLAIATLFAAGVAFGQGGAIGVFGDQAGANCNLTIGAGALATLYIVHTSAPGVTGSEFSAPKPACMLDSYIADQTVWAVTVGNSQTGVSVGYGTCQATPVLVLKVLYFGTGATPACCRYSVLPHPVTGLISVVDCVDNLLTATGGQGIINPNASCQCDVPVEDTTWGQVKALYTD